MNSRKAKSKTGDGASAGELRLQVYLARAGIASRRSAVEYLEKGRIRVNGKLVKEPGYRLTSEDEVTFDGKPLRVQDRMVYFALHKPAKFVCSTTDEANRPLALDLIQPFVKERLFTVGRLDYMTSGLLFFTNDGNWARYLTHPSSRVEKEYIVQTKKDIPVELLEEFKVGLRVEGELFQCRDYVLNGPHSVHLILSEGKNREIRKVFQSRNITVKRVHRLRVGPVVLRGIEPGRFRKLTEYEIKALLKEPNSEKDHHGRRH